jgi:hypothetical protein
MKKIILLSIIFIDFLFAVVSAESKIIKLVFDSLFQKEIISVFVNTDDKSKIIIEAGFELAISCSKADIIYATEIQKACPQKATFTDNYETFKDNINVIGAFYWSKGRPNIMFDSNRLKKFNLVLPESLKKYETEVPQ